MVIPVEQRHLAGCTNLVAVVEMEPKLAGRSYCCSFRLPDAIEAERSLKDIGKQSCHVFFCA